MVVIVRQLPQIIYDNYFWVDHSGNILGATEELSYTLKIRQKHEID